MEKRVFPDREMPFFVANGNGNDYNSTGGKERKEEHEMYLFCGR